jgi:two-component system CheB/CheR fusion protein
MNRIRVVGIGASAGGLEAFSDLLHDVAEDTGMAFVLVSHLSPTHPSELARILAGRTAMPVREASDGEAVEPNHVYVIPPGCRIAIADGRLHLADRLTGGTHPDVIDRFFESLAHDLGPQAVGVVLSGTGFDGTAGLKAIKARNGTTYAQDPSTAAFDGMPRSAVQSGAVDFVLAIDAIAWALATDGPPAEIPESDAEALEEIIQILRSQTAVDFQHYGRASLGRRIRRRVADLHLEDLNSYLARLRSDPEEATALFRAVLVHVTHFFREPEAFAALQADVLPTLLKRRGGGGSLRAWVVGCATGEQVYSLAMAVLEMEAVGSAKVSLRIFASDLSDSALATARLGSYSRAISEHVSPDRLARFFVPVEGGHRVTERLREMCVFAHHDVTRDPPFGQIDLVLCSNVLIYLDPVLQRRALENLHYALKPDGYLLLSAAETVGRAEELYSIVDRKRGLYQRRPGPGRLRIASGRSDGRLGLGASPARTRTAAAAWSTVDLQRAAESVYFSEYPTASVIVNGELEVLHFQGQTGQYLEAPSGGPTVQLLRLAHPDLRAPLARMIRKARADAAPVRRAAVRLGTGARARRVEVGVLPMPPHGAEDHHYLVVFGPASIPARDGGAGVASTPDAAAEAPSRIAELEAELAETKEYLEGLIGQHDVTLTELQTAYDSSLSINEEYLSTNEELESAKEELQSLNEELTTLNEQLQGRNSDLNARTAELGALLESLDMPIMLLGANLGIKAFNSRAAADLGLREAQLGHTADAVELPLAPERLRELVALALRDDSMQEQELRDEQGRWKALRIWPVSRTVEHPEGGIVAIALIDIAKLKGEVGVANAAVAYSDSIVQTVPHPLVVLDADFRMTRANEAFHRAFGTDAATVTGRPISEIAAGGADQLDALLERAARSDHPVRGPDLELTIGGTGPRTFQASAGRIGRVPGFNDLLLALEDTTIRTQAEAAAIEASRMQVVGQLAGGVAHEINNQMTVVLGFTSYLLEGDGSARTNRADLGAIMKAAQRSADVTRELLAFSRRQRLESVVFELNAMVSGAQTLLGRLLGPDIVLEIMLGADVGAVRADPARLEQVLVNLVMNARDAMRGRRGLLRIETSRVMVTDPETATASVAVMPPGCYARLIVTDSGTGMDAPTTSRIFEPFFTTKPVGEGTGLGLAGVYGTVKQSGGSIWVESELGHGTTFTIDLPQVIAGPPAKPAVPNAAPAGGDETILVVDDEEAVRNWVSRSLREKGYRVLEARNAEDALRLAGAEPDIGLIVSDAMMPGAGSGELRKLLMNGNSGRGFLFVSGSGREELILLGCVRREDAYMQKPFTGAALAERVRALLDAR